jgi:hypothetical protein
LLLAVAGGGCGALRERHVEHQHEATRQEHGPLLHVVLIRLAEPAGAHALATESADRLARIPSVVGLQVGGPTDIGRAGVDLDFDVGIVVSFAGQQGYRDYLEHPEHVALVAAWKPRWSSIRVFDISADGVPPAAPCSRAATGVSATR